MAEEREVRFEIVKPLKVYYIYNVGVDNVPSCLHFMANKRVHYWPVYSLVACRLSIVAITAA